MTLYLFARVELSSAVHLVARPLARVVELEISWLENGQAINWLWLGRILELLQIDGSPVHLAVAMLLSIFEIAAVDELIIGRDPCLLLLDKYYLVLAFTMEPAILELP